MIKIKYNIDLKILRERYLNVFNLEAMRNNWAPYENTFGIEIDALLTADFEELVNLYYLYKSTDLTEDQTNDLKSLFDYECYQPKLAWFFMNPENKFDFSTCHYCNTAYINAYGRGDSYQNVLDSVNNATRADWRCWFSEDALSDVSITQILSEKPYRSLSEFNGKKYLYKNIELYSCMTLAPKNNQFDLDHILPKKLCPITSLSLFNLAPSCQVCNEKLKQTRELAKNKTDWLKVSPTYQGNSFDQDVSIMMIPEVSCSTFFELMRNRDNYRLEFDTHKESVYEDYVTTFRLRDRYNYHKKLALQILDLKERYSEEKIKEISRMLSKRPDGKIEPKYSETQIREDIFRMDFSKDRCFSKLHKDMMERN